MFRCHQNRPLRAYIVLWLLALGWLPVRMFCQSDSGLAANRKLSLPEYVAELQAASRALDSTSADAIHEFRMSLPDQWIVDVDGQSLAVRTDWLSAALRMQEVAPASSNGRVRLAKRHLDALREAAEGAVASGNQELQQSRARVDGILSAREFQGTRGPSWFDRIKARIDAWISRQLQKIFGRVGISARVGSALAWVLVSAAALLLAFWVVTSLIAAASRTEMDLRGAAPAGQDWRYWAGLARETAANGDYRAAVHAAYWAAIARLEERRLLPEDRSRTPRESLRLVQQGTSAYAPLSQLTRRFELVWYGYRLATPADWNDAARQLEILGCLYSSTTVTVGS